MKRPNKRNKYLKSRSDKNRQRFVKQRNVCLSILRKTNRNYHSNLNTKNVVNNWQIWKTVRPVLSNKLLNSKKVTLVDNEKTNDKEIPKASKDFFKTACLHIFLICRWSGTNFNISVFFITVPTLILKDVHTINHFINNQQKKLNKLSSIERKLRQYFSHTSTIFKNSIFWSINCFRFANVMKKTRIINIFNSDNSNIAYINT